MATHEYKGNAAQSLSWFVAENIQWKTFAQCLRVLLGLRAGFLLGLIGHQDCTLVLVALFVEEVLLESSFEEGLARDTSEGVREPVPDLDILVC